MSERCIGADDPEERCPRHPSECTCWQVDLGHPNYAPLNDFHAKLKEVIKVHPWFPRTIVPPPEDRRFLAVVEGKVRFVFYGKTSHVPIYGFCLVDQGAEDCDLCQFEHWMELPSPPKCGGKV